MLSKWFNFTNFNITYYRLGILDSAYNDSIFKNNEVFINQILLILKGTY